MNYLLFDILLLLRFTWFLSIGNWYIGMFITFHIDDHDDYHHEDHDHDHDHDHDNDHHHHYHHHHHHHHRAMGYFKCLNTHETSL